MAIINSKTVLAKNGKLIALRSASEADAVALKALAMDNFKTSEYLVTTPDEFSSFTEEQQRARIKLHEEPEGNLLLLAEFEGELIGMIDFSCGKRKRNAHRGAFGMSVQKEWRNQGVGSMLLSTLVEWARSHRTIEVICLVVSEENKPAVHLYEKMGFVVTGREPYGLKVTEGKYLVDLSMSLYL